MKKLSSTLVAALLSGTMFTAVVAQPPEGDQGRSERAERRAGPGFGRPEGRGGPPADFPPGRGPAVMLQALPLMIALDADKDGTISESEIKNATAALQSLDKNADGMLTIDELRPDMRALAEMGGPEGRGGPLAPGGFRGGPGPGGPGMPADPEAAAARMMEFDKNNDGKLAKDELPEQMQARTIMADADGDGFVTKEELLTMMENAADRPGFGGDRGAGGGSPEAMVNRAFADSDADKDGKLSTSEVPERLRERFADIDSNGDQFIDKRELGAAMARMLGRGQGQRGGPGRPGGRPDAEGNSRPNRANDN